MTMVKFVGTPRTAQETAARTAAAGVKAARLERVRIDRRRVLYGAGTAFALGKGTGGRHRKGT